MADALQLVDSHAHLDYPQLADDLEAVLDRARAAGVGQVISVGTDLRSSHAARRIAESHPGVFATAGVHPHEAAKCSAADWPALGSLWRDPRTVAVGETGLDYYYDFAPREVQLEVFRRQLEQGGEHGLPVVIHLRDAYEDAFALIKEVGLAAGGVLHCFSAGPAECETALELGLHVSLSGIVTFPWADSVREAARLIPSHRILVETDAPYLAPAPHRGRRNEPALVVHTARRVAEARREELAVLCQNATENAARLFRLERVP